MMKSHSIKTVIIDHIPINYFYTREKRDANGNARYRVYIIDPDASAVYETIFKCYEFEIESRVKMFVEGAQH